MSTGALGVAATSAGDFALFAGGVAFNSQSNVEVFDASTGTWSIFQLSTDRGAMGATSVGTLAIFGGGVQGTSGTGFQSSDVVDFFDTSTGVWTTGLLPTASGASSATSVGTKALFTNGSAVDIFDTATGTWTSMTLTPIPRLATSATSAGTKAFFIGGPSAAASALVDVYDDSTGQWGVEPLPVPRHGVALTSSGNQVFFAGGWDTAAVAPSDVVDIYDVVTSTWRSARLTEARQDAAATAVGTKVFFAGGRGGATTGSATVDIYDTATDTWSTASLSAGRSGIAATTVDGRALFAGGAVCALNCTYSSFADIYDDRLGVRYCSPGVINSTGAASTLQCLGFPGSVAQGAAMLVARGLPPQTLGYFLTSNTQGLTVGPGGSQGDLCLGGAIGRFVGPGQSLNSGPDGRIQLTIDLTSLPQPNGVAVVQPGETWNFQAWYRDANPGPTSNFTDAVAVTFQ
ncbi:MAG: kelch repeat-containing protein [Planctomycetota bacterium]